MLCMDEFTNRIVGREQYNEFIFVDVPRPASERIPGRSVNAVWSKYAEICSTGTLFGVYMGNRLCSII